jgi:hypothetical protein
MSPKTHLKPQKQLFIILAQELALYRQRSKTQNHHSKILSTMKKYIQHHLPVLMFQFFFMALALVITLSFSSKGYGEKLSKKARLSYDYLGSMEISEKEELALMEEIVTQEYNDILIATPYTVKIFNQQGELVFEEVAYGSNPLENKKINAYVRKSNLLMEHANEYYYLLKE